jgi:2-hydroxychromene-2-carboxylate isomerase
LARHRAAGEATGSSLRGSPTYPVDPQLLALRVGIVAAAEDWCADYTKATFRTWFLESKASGLPENVENVLRSLGRPTGDILARAAAPETDTRLKQETDAARQLGIFGAPTFVAGREIFWGDDRLEDAVAFLRRRRRSAGKARTPPCPPGASF